MNTCNDTFNFGEDNGESVTTSTSQLNHAYIYGKMKEGSIDNVISKEILNEMRKSVEQYKNETTTINKTSENYEIGTSCLICGETVPMIGIHDAPKICDKCRAAVMKMREQILAQNKNISRCYKCVYNHNYCGHDDYDGSCKTYKKDPPDGGYYG